MEAITTTHQPQTGTDATALDTLAAHIRTNGPIAAVRASSARSVLCPNGHSSNYWGAVRYTIRLRRDGVVTATADERASSDRTVRHLADRDADDIGRREGRVRIYGNPGRLTEAEAGSVLAQLAETVAAN